MKINTEQIGKIAEYAAKGFACIGLLALLKSLQLDIEIGNQEAPEVSEGYADAVQAVMSNIHFGSDKTKAIAAIKKMASTDYYKAVICILESAGFASDKIEMIHALNGNGEV